MDTFILYEYGAPLCGPKARKGAPLKMSKLNHWRRTKNARGKKHLIMAVWMRGKLFLHCLSSGADFF